MLGAASLALGIKVYIAKLFVSEANKYDALTNAY